jgi:ketosteroid isomerase-like protein
MRAIDAALIFMMATWAELCTAQAPPQFDSPSSTRVPNELPRAAQGVVGDSAKAPTNKSAEATATAEVRKAQDDLIDAYLRRDVGALDRLLADEYTFVNDDPGGVADKQQILTSFGSGGDRKITSYRRQDERVRLYGDVAVLTYRYQSTETYRGQNSGGDYRVTRILVKRDGRWQMVNGQETKVSPMGQH